MGLEKLVDTIMRTASNGLVLAERRISVRETERDAKM
jgi:hypothetical protein